MSKIAIKALIPLTNVFSTFPFIKIGKTSEALSITFETASNAVNRLVDANILVQTSNAKRNRTFAYKTYLDILRNGT